MATQGRATIPDRKFLLALIYAIVLFKWLEVFEPATELYVSLNPAAGLGGSTILIEDLLVVLLSFIVVGDLSLKRSLWTFLWPLLKPILVFLAIGFFFLGYSILLKGAGDVLANFRLFALGVLGVGAAIAFRNENNLYRFLIFIIVIWFIDSSYQYYLRWEEGGWLYFGKGYVYVNRMYGALGFIASLAILHAKRSSRPVKACVGIALMLYLVTLMLDGARGPILCVILATGIFMLLEGVRLKRLLVTGTLVGLIMLVFFSYNSERTLDTVRSMQDLYQISGSVYARWVAWDILFQRFMESPILGHGLGNHGDAIDLFIQQHAGDLVLYIGSAHNAHLVFLYKIGLLGVLSYIALALILARRAAKSVVGKSSFLRSAGHAAVAGVVAYFLYAATSPLGPSFHYYFWFYLSLLTAVITISRRQEKALSIHAS